MTNPVRNIFAFDRSGTVNVAYGTSRALFADAGLSGTPTSRLSFGSDITSWSLDAWGTTLLAVPNGETLYQWTGGASATAVTEAPDDITCMLVTHTRQVMALGTNEESGGTFNGRCIRWSTTEDYSSAGSWTSSSSNLAGEYILDGSGLIVAARLMGPYVAVWTDSGQYLGDYTADPGNPWRFEPVVGGVGIAGPNCVTVFQGRAYFLGMDMRLYSWTVGEPPSPIACPISEDFERGLLPSIRNKTFVGSIGKFGEIWILYPDDSSGITPTENNRYIALSLTESARAQRPVWFKGDLARTAILDSGPLATISGMQANKSGTIMGTSSGTVLVQEVMASISQSRTWHIQSADQYVDESRRRMMVRSFIPDFEARTADAVNVSLTLFVRSHPQASATTKGPYTVATSATKKDLRASGKVIAAKLSGSFAVDIGKPLFDVVPMGER